MQTLNIAVALFLLANAGVGLLLLRRERTIADRLVIVNLMGTTSVVAVLLVGAAAGMAAADDVALVAAMLAPFTSLTFARRLWWRGTPPGEDDAVPPAPGTDRDGRAP
ncbi:monovalent cation/H+ antiporter complex subunit F [Azospirillum halopraeferens]|uniref:monovalent cation/H+ antiporter complex subunit F n=1 Tax=Azospirillum halopraeferens TaxID=34010 RepID=UPI0003FC1662|nr:monovalent cation/H+ antiporter complex subunit F [Azospirillum halopraeferens]